MIRTVQFHKAPTVELLGVSIMEPWLHSAGKINPEFEARLDSHHETP